MSNSSPSYGGDAVAGVAGKIAGIIGGYATLWLLTDMLTSAGYGGYVAALAAVSLFSLVAQAGLRQATIQRVGELVVADNAEAYRYAGAAVTWVAILSVVVTIIILILSPLLQLVFDSELIRWIRLLVVVMPGMAVLSVCNGVLRGFERIPAAILFRQIAVQVLRLVGLAVVWITWQDPVGVVIAIAISHYLPIALLAVRSGGWQYLNISSMSRSHMRYSGYLLFNSIAGRFLKDTDVLLLAAVATLSETGGYSVAWKLAIVARYADTILTNTLQPRLSKFLASDQRAQLRQEFNQVRDIAVAGAIPVLIAVILFGDSLLELFGDYTSQRPVLLLLTVGAIVNATFGSVGQILIMGKRGRLLLVNTIVSLGGNIALNLLLIPRYGTIGAATATVFSVYFLTNFIGMLEVRYFMKINTMDWTTLSLSAIVLICVLMIIGGVSIADTAAVVAAIAVLMILLYRQRRFAVSSLRDIVSTFV
jgi:O-antigen/teichoic acid export membrane protein